MMAKTVKMKTVTAWALIRPNSHAIVAMQLFYTRAGARGWRDAYDDRSICRIAKVEIREIQS